MNTLKYYSVVAVFLLLAIGSGSESEKEKENVSTQTKVAPIWDMIPTLDEFGDPTGDSTLFARFTDGKMTNSAGSGDLAVELTEINEGLLLKIFHYAGEAAHKIYHKDMYGKLNIKYSDGNTEKSNFLWSQKKQGIIISKRSKLYKNITTIGNNKKIKVNFQKSSFYPDFLKGTTSGDYTFSITTR